MLKMAVNIGTIFRRPVFNYFSPTLVSINNHYLCANQRTLYSRSSLGLDSFEEQRQRITMQLSNVEDKLKARMKEYVADDKNMVFTEDLKNIIHIANSDEDVKLIVQMIKKFNKQDKQMRFGTFIFGPVVMRLFYLMNKPEIAQQCFKDEENSGFFDQLITYQIYLDLLYENKMYKEILENFDLIYSKQIQGAMFPRNSIVLVMAACYKLNNADSLDYALKSWNKAAENGYFFNRRAVTFCAALFLNQGKLDMALEIVSNARNQSYTTVRNIKVLILSKLGRLEDVITLLKTVLNQDAPNVEIHTFNRDVIEQVKKNFHEADNPELNIEFNRIEELFQKQGHISDKTLDEQLCSEIQQPAKIKKFHQNDRESYNRQGSTNYRTSKNFSQVNRNKYRLGLEDLS